MAHHLGWAVVVTADERRVVDRRRIELVAESLPAAPIHHHGGAHPMHAGGEHLDDQALSELVAGVRSSIVEHVNRAFDDLVADLDGPVRSISLRDWPGDFPTDIGTLRRPPYESRVDSIMYREVMAEAATARGWAVHRFDAKSIERQAADLLGDDGRVIADQRAILGPPWNQDHRIAFAATIMAAERPAPG